MQVRPARPDDIDAIVGFSTDTFEWGDYVPSMVADWITGGEGIVLVAVEDDDTPIAISRAVFLTDHEVWCHATRVHPDHRGRRIAGTVIDGLADWAAERDGYVMRLMIEDDNDSSIRHASKEGFRMAVSVVRATRTIGAASPNPDGNGGLRNPSPLTSKPAKSPDLPLVRSSWSTSQTGRSLRGLIGTGWRFHRLRDRDIDEAAKNGNLWEIANSWAITETIEPVFSVRLLDTAQDEAYEVIRSLIDTANNRGAEGFSLWIADIEWLVRAARRAGCDTARFGIWERPL